MSSGTYDPYTVVNLVVRELARDGVKTTFDMQEIAKAASAAENLLTALGVAPVVPHEDAGE